MELDIRTAAKIRNILELVEIQSCNDCLFAGDPVSLPRPSPYPLGEVASQVSGAATSPEAVPVVSNIQRRLYETFYCRDSESVPPDTVNSRTFTFKSDAQFIEYLTAANRGHERWEDGWQIYQLDASGLVYAQRNTAKQMFLPGQYRSVLGESVRAAVGLIIRAWMAKETRNEHPGFYLALSETPLDEDDPATFFRLYWNVNARGAPPLLSAVTQHLNRFQVPFRFKCLLNWREYGRADAAVLFVNKRFHSIVLDLLPRIYADIKGELNADTPLFTKILAPGLGLGEDPGNGESFGMNRCRLLAEGLWNAFAKGIQSDQERFVEVCHHFEGNGISLLRPYLAPGGIDHYQPIALPIDQ
jgi:hypothetical protein